MPSHLTPLASLSTVTRCLRNRGKAIPKIELGAYKEDLDRLWEQVTQVQTNIRILGHILQFPFELTLIDPHPYWTTTSRALFESTVLGLWRLLVDDASDVVSLPKLKNTLIRNIPVPESQAAWGKARKARLGKRHVDIENRLAILRDKYLAHRTREIPSGTDPIGTDALIALDKLCTIKNYAITFLAVLSVEQGHSADHLEYSDLATPRRKSDIEKVMDLLVKDSNWLNLPERDPAWQVFKANMSADELALFRKYRSQFKLPEDP